MTKNVVILGAGPSGLSTAYHLERRRFDTYAIYEQKNYVGGTVHTRRIGGYLFDCAVHVLYFRHQHVLALVRDLLHGNLVRHDRVATVYYKGTYVPYPFHANLWALSETIRRECRRDFSTADAQRRATAPPLLPEWIETTFGRGIARHFVLPFNQKLWGPHFSRVDSDWLAGALPLDGLRAQVLGGVGGAATTQLGNNRDFWYPVRGGIQSLPDALAAGVRNLALEKEVVQVNWARRTVRFGDGATAAYNVLVSTLPLSRLDDVLTPPLPELRHLRTKLAHVSVACVCVGLNHQIEEPAHWIYYSDLALPFARVSFPFRYASSMTPEGRHSAIAEVPYHGPYPPDGLVENTVTGLVRVGLVRKAEDVSVTTVIDIPHAYCVPLPGQREAIEKARSALSRLNIYSIGRYGSWEYSNVESAILWGERTAARLAG